MRKSLQLPVDSSRFRRGEAEVCARGSRLVAGRQGNATEADLKIGRYRDGLAGLKPGVYSGKPKSTGRSACATGVGAFLVVMILWLIPCPGAVFGQNLDKPVMNVD